MSGYLEKMGLSTELLVRFMSENPFFYGVFCQMRTQWKDEKDFPFYGAVGFTGRGFTLFLNRQRWDKLDDASKLFLLCHECAHVALGHVPPDSDTMQLNKPIVNVAMDLVINEHFREYQQTELGKGGVWLASFPMLPQSIADQDWRGLYALLMQEAQKQAEQAGAQGMDDHEFGGEGGDEEGLTNADLQELARAETENINRVAARHCQMRGADAAIPKQIRIELERPKKTHMQTVRELLQQFVMSSRDTKKRMTWRRVSRRLGPIAKGRLSARLPKCAIAVDTSGSMCGQDTIDLMAQAVSAICAVADSVEVVTGDTSVQARGKVTAQNCITEFPKLVVGGGGTTLTPLLEALKESGNYDCVILITDGFHEALSPLQPTIGLIVPSGVDSPGLKKSVHLKAVN
jgi:predicted metal-dependent peptidase